MNENLLWRPDESWSKRIIDRSWILIHGNIEWVMEIYIESERLLHHVRFLGFWLGLRCIALHSDWIREKRLSGWMDTVFSSISPPLLLVLFFSFYIFFFFSSSFFYFYPPLSIFSLFCLRFRNGGRRLTLRYPISCLTIPSFDFFLHFSSLSLSLSPSNLQTESKEQNQT